MKKDNSILIRLDDNEARILNDGWFDYVNYKGHPVSKADYIREALKVMRQYLNGDIVEHVREEALRMADLSLNQKAHLKAFDDGVKYACRKMLDKLYYVPENWKEKETKALYDIIYYTIQDLEALVTHEEG